MIYIIIVALIIIAFMWRNTGKDIAEYEKMKYQSELNTISMGLDEVFLKEIKLNE